MLESFEQLNTSLQRTIEDDSYGLKYESSAKSHASHDNELIFTAQQSPARIFGNLKPYKDLNKLVDVRLVSTTDSLNYINAHKIILSSASPYFHAQFCGGFMEEQQGLVKLDISFPILNQIIDFIYTASISVNELNVQNLLQSAKLLHIDDIANACSLYLYLNMDASNVLGIHELAETYACAKLLEQTQNYANSHFEEVICSSEFLNLSAQKLCQFLSCDQLKVTCESKVFTALLDWVKYDIDNRRLSLGCLFKCIRFHYVPPNLLKEQMQTSELLKRNDMMTYRDCLQKTVEDLVSHKPCPYSNRKPFIKFALYVFGGYQRQSLNMAETFKLCGSSGWDNCDAMRYPRSGVACVTSSFFIFVIGGRNSTLNGNIDCADVECFDPLINSWRVCSPMSVPRSRPAG